MFYTPEQIAEVNKLACKLAPTNDKKGLNKGFNLAFKKLGINKASYIAFGKHCIASMEAEEFCF